MDDLLGSPRVASLFASFFCCSKSREPFLFDFVSNLFRSVRTRALVARQRAGSPAELSNIFLIFFVRAAPGLRGTRGRGGRLTDF